MSLGKSWALPPLGTVINISFPPLGMRYYFLVDEITQEEYRARFPPPLFRGQKPDTLERSIELGLRQGKPSITVSSPDPERPIGTILRVKHSFKVPGEREHTGNLRWRPRKEWKPARPGRPVCYDWERQDNEVTLFLHPTPSGFYCTSISLDVILGPNVEEDALKLLRERKRELENRLEVLRRG